MSKIKEIFVVTDKNLLDDLGENWNPVIIRTHFLIKELLEMSRGKIRIKAFKYLNINSKRYHLSASADQIMKFLVLSRSVLYLAFHRPYVYFVYPWSFTWQTKLLFDFSTLINLTKITDVQDNVEQSMSLGLDSSVDPSKYEFEKKILVHSEIILFVNAETRDYLLTKYPSISSAQSIFVANGYDANLFKHTRTDHNKKDMDASFKLCYVGNISKNRGIEILIDAGVLLHNKHPSFRLVFITPEKVEIPESMKDDDKDYTFIDTIHVPHKLIPRTISSMDLMAMLYDPKINYMNVISPTKLFEYIGAGKPVICSKCKSIQSIPESDAFIFVEFNVESVFQKVDSLIQNPNLIREAIGKTIRIRESHSWKSRCIALYEGIKDNTN